MADLIKIAEEAFATGKEHPKFKAGDTVTVAYPTVPWRGHQDFRPPEQKTFHGSQNVRNGGSRTYIPD